MDQIDKRLVRSFTRYMRVDYSWIQILLLEMHCKKLSQFHPVHVYQDLVTLTPIAF